MCDKETDDLINLSMEEYVVAKSNYILPLPLIEVQPNSPEPRLSLDNNPFDLVQKLAICRQDDPFEVVEKEASLKAQMSLSKANNDVKTGNLLSLSGDNNDATNFDSAHFSVFSNSTIYESAEVNDLESESPPITLSTKCTPDSSTAESGGCTGLSCDSSDSGKKPATNTRNRKLRHLRHRLLKMSVSNSTYNTPLSSIKAAYNDDDQMIAAESPLKSMFDDLLSAQPIEMNYTEKDFDDDLKKMQIPMLNQMRSPIKQTNSSNHDKRELNTLDLQETSPNDSKLPDLESIRLKLSAKRSENNRHDINDLINNLKTLICQSHAVDEQKKQQVNNLLETLSSTLNTESKESFAQPITRQGTFNCDLHENNDKLIAMENAIGGIEQATVDEMPDIMMRSSATYDGDTTEDKEHLNLPQIDPSSPPKEHQQQHVQPIISEFMEQLQNFLEQQQSSASKQHETCKSTQANGPSTATNNPTFIVVLNTVSHEENNEFSAYNQNSNGMRRRSQSLSLHDKVKFLQIPLRSSVEINTTETFDSPPLSEEITPPPLDTTEASDFKTPARFFQRRNSFSSGTSHSPMRYSRFSNLPLDKSRSNSSQLISQSTTSSARRLSIMDTHNESQLTQTLSRPKLEIIKPDLKKKVKSSAGVVTSNEPMKATLPLKNFASNIKTKTQSASASNTSIHLVAKSGHMSNTSTPMPELRTNILKVKGKAMPSPGKLGASHTARLSNLSTTPIGKSLGAPTASAVGFRRRTLSEFKPKSPMKTRSSAASSGVNNGGTLPKVNLTKLRPSTYLKSTTNSRRSSLYEPSAHPANRNKENNQA